MSNETDQQREAAIEHLKYQLSQGFVPTSEETDLNRRQAEALEFIAFALGQIHHALESIRIHVARLDK